MGSQLVADVNEMIAEYCEAGIPPEVDSTNSHVAIRTLIQGGKTEHQRITLSSDSGTTRDTPAFRLTISDQNANIWNSPCFAWGVPSLDINSIIDINLFSHNIVSLTASLILEAINLWLIRQFFLRVLSLLETL